MVSGYIENSDEIYAAERRRMVEEQIIARGVNLGKIMQEAGGPGCGGHAVAAGANIPPAELESFLLKAGKLIEASNGKQR